MKRIISMFILICMLYTTVCVGVVSATETEKIWIVYTYDNEAVIYGYNGNDEVVTIPSIINDCPVVEISNFGANEKVTTVNIPDSVETIGFDTFIDCPNLKVVNIGSGVNKIGGYLDYRYIEEYPDPVPTESEIPYKLFNASENAILQAMPPRTPAFGNCPSLEKIVVSSDNAVFSSEDGVLFNKDKTIMLRCPEGKTGSYTVPNTVTAFGEIGELYYHVCSPFYKCAKLEELIIPDSVVGKIGNSACMDSLKRIYIGKGITDLSGYTPPNILLSLSLENIEISPQNDGYISENGVLFSKDKSMLVRFPSAKSGDYVVPNSVKEISSYAFSEVHALNSLKLSENLEVIDGYAFLGCNLKKLNLPAGIKEIRVYAFSGMELEGFDWPEHIEEIGYGMFLGCKNLKSINMSENIKVIDGKAFEDTGFESFDWPETVNVIDPYTFANCKNLKKVNITGEIDEIDSSAFEGSAIEEFVWPATAKKVSSQVFQNCNNLKKVTVPEGITSIGAWVFKNASIEEFICPKSVTAFGYKAFADCPNLRTIYYTGTEEEWESISKSDKAVPNNIAVVCNYIVYPKTEIQLLGSDGNAVESLKSGETVSARAVCGASVKENSNVYMALYDKNGELKDIKFSLPPVTTDENVTFTTESMTIPENSEGCYIKIFLWTDELNPLNNAVIIK